MFFSYINYTHGYTQLVPYSHPKRNLAELSTCAIIDETHGA